MSTTDPTPHTDPDQPELGLTQSLNEWSMRKALLTPASALTQSDHGAELLPILADLAVWFDAADVDSRSSARKLLHGIADGWPLSTWSAITQAIADAAPY